MDLRIFSHLDFLPALKALFKDLKVPMNYVADEPTTAREILKDTYKENDNFQLMDDVYFVGMVDNAAFEGNNSLAIDKIKSDYDGILIFGITLKDRPNGLLPTRSQLAEIARAFNREFYYTPVVVVFKYGNCLAFANTERLKYKQEWREGEKAGKVSLLRDIHMEKPHSGHERILAELQIPATGNKKVDSFAKLYAYWQEVFSVSLLNKKFYQELSNWYFWATKHVTFPGEPTLAEAHLKNANLEDLLQEHRATNVIRMLTRLLFVWFIKEKKLIPEELFELDALQKDILNEISPYHEKGMFKERNKESVYYKAILQNLFFATLNCPIEPDNLDKRSRGFRGDGYGTHRGIDYLMRYKQYFKNPDVFLEKLNQTVPFLNGGLFECLDDKPNNIYIDGFSDQMTKGEQLIVPDYLFFGLEEETDISDVVGINDKKYKSAAVKGLINLLKSYKFTITENTPIEEDVALDPELLGKVFENLLASYNPETKTTARKQTGSFYTPREIVNYMVDESLIAYLKNKILAEPSVYLEFGTIQSNLFGNEGKKGQQSLINDVNGSELKNNEAKIDTLLHELVSFNPGNPFKDFPNTSKHLLKYLSDCTILDPACGSGAFPMGVLQKMVHILQKLDPENKVWKEVQLGKAEQESKAAFAIEDKQAREERLLEINEAFDQSINDPDYARKLFLIENCIYGVDIQPIATQISKLRFFISLVVEQKVNPHKDNFGIRPLPNLETKFVAANTLMGIKKDGGLFETIEVKKLENELKIVRHKIFSLKSKERKITWRKKDKELREKLSMVLKSQGLPLDAAEKLAKWDPYDQNASSPFFDSEWMFGMKIGFSIVIGNPPYINTKSGIQSEFKEYYKEEYNTAVGQFDLFSLFIEQSLRHTKILSFIVPKPIINNENYEVVRKLLLRIGLQSIVTGSHIFENAGVESCIFITNPSAETTNVAHFSMVSGFKYLFSVNPQKFKGLPFTIINSLLSPDEYSIIDLAKTNASELGSIISILRGVETGRSDNSINSNGIGFPLLRGEDLNAYQIKNSGLWINADFQNYVKFKAKELYLSPKLCIRRVGNKVTAAVDVENCISLNTIYNCHIKPSDKSGYWGLAAILNSTLINYWFYKVFILDDALFPYQRVSQLEKIPINTNFRNKTLNFLSALIHVSYDSVINHIIDSYIFNLYFPEHMKERGIDVLEYVEQDMVEVMQGREFEKLSDPEKEQVIEALHAKWSHPDNEVRNRIKLFAVRSPEILKPILES
ncbi:MAG: Eco57I restriction-modification methylase domain-containing protein [Bacteroidales bacterium]|nr:Eco57I restriction-modification methylase domain-containing protein [Bacteroidales bacterium]